MQGGNGVQQMSWLDGAAIPPPALPPKKREGIPAKRGYDRKETELLQKTLQKRREEYRSYRL